MYSNTINSLPKQQVLAFVSNLSASEIPGSGCWWFSDNSHIRLLILVLTLVTDRSDNFRFLFLFCWVFSFLPPMIVPSVVTCLVWDLGLLDTYPGTLEDTWEFRSSISICICSMDLLFTPPWSLTCLSWYSFLCLWRFSR